MTELRSFEYRHEGVVLNGQLAMPPGPGPHPGVLVMHDLLGQNELVRQRARELAAAGYAALATDMYGGARRFSVAEVQEVTAPLRADPARLRARVVAGFEAFRELPEVDASRIGAIGYCFGGQCVLELARSGAEARAVVSFHGLLKTDLPARPGEVKAKALVLAGALDPYAPPEDVRAFQAEMSAAGVDWHLTLYGEGWHAFTEEDARDIAEVPGVRYDPLLDRLSWAQATAFLDAVVRG